MNATQTASFGSTGSEKVPSKSRWIFDAEVGGSILTSSSSSIGYTSSLNGSRIDPKKPALAYDTASVKRIFAVLYFSGSLNNTESLSMSGLVLLM